MDLLGPHNRPDGPSPSPMRMTEIRPGITPGMTLFPNPKDGPLSSDEPVSGRMDQGQQAEYTQPEPGQLEYPPQGFGYIWTRPAFVPLDSTEDSIWISAPGLVDELDVQILFPESDQIVPLPRHVGRQLIAEISHSQLASEWKPGGNGWSQLRLVGLPASFCEDLGLTFPQTKESATYTIVASPEPLPNESILRSPARDSPGLPAPNQREMSDKISPSISNKALTETGNKESKGKRKRQRLNDSLDRVSDHGEGDGSDDSDCSVSRRPTTRSDEPAQGFACPFYRWDPNAHMGCLSLKLKRIRDLKQHLQRRHYTPPCYCPICFKKFSSDGQRDDHIRSQLCQLQKPTAAEKNLKVVSERAQALLRQKVDRTLSPVDQWYDVWHIVFGKDAPRPSNPFLGSIVEETMGMFREFWTAKGPEIISRFLEARSRPTAAKNYSELRSLLIELFSEVGDQFDRKIRGKGGGDGPDTAPVHSLPPPCSAVNHPAPCSASTTPRPSLEARPQRWDTTSSSVSSTTSDPSCPALVTNSIDHQTPLAAAASGPNEASFQQQNHVLVQNQGPRMGAINYPTDANTGEDALLYMPRKQQQYRDKTAQVRQLPGQKMELLGVPPPPLGFPDHFSDSPQWTVQYNPASYQTEPINSRMENPEWEARDSDTFKKLDTWEDFVFDF
ncbi:hypothetical protein B0T24DRAFT_627080 [Lasiosphaeria ovina]|uniref:C2H2-type domain-containing protein n=1 Tax=Lasiosphaeria ovina TaxID=92902 RepID=A0AAE0K686_9PEZI|nr:hypothetical protein B0T24DRAFT_627080 [Lasiosphaeria ovina]